MALRQPHPRGDLWDHPHFQDRVVRLWAIIADRYKGNPWVAGYNPVNEPADDSGRVLPAFYERLAGAIRAVDPHHVLFLDGNHYSTDFDLFGDPIDNAVYTCHDYARAGFARSGGHPAEMDGVRIDKDQVEEAFLRRTAYMRKTGTPIWIGEFGPVYTGDPARDEQCAQLLADQLEVYMGLFFAPSSWEGEPVVREPEWCWWPLDALPEPIVEYTRVALAAISTRASLAGG